MGREIGYQFLTFGMVWQHNIADYDNRQGVRLESRWLGDEADASKIKKEELVQSYQLLTKEVIDMLVRSLNGENPGEMPELTGLNKADDTF